MDEEYLHELFSPFGAITVRRMFGGQGLYTEGKIFGLILDDEIFIKVDDETAPLFSAAGSSSFVYDGKTKPLQMPYWRLPLEAMDDPEALVKWARLGRAAAFRAKSPAKRRVKA